MALYSPVEYSLPARSVEKNSPNCEVHPFLGERIITHPSQLSEEEKEKLREMGMRFPGDPAYFN